MVLLNCKNHFSHGKQQSIEINQNERAVILQAMQFLFYMFATKDIFSSICQIVEKLIVFLHGIESV